MQSTINAVAFPVPPRSWSAAVLRRRSDLILLQTASGETTAAVHIVNRRRADSRPLTILYSHANAEDLGLSLPFADVLSRFCGCDVLAYEYLGYSISSGEPSEAGCLECVDAALAYLLDDCGLEPHRVVVYGRSIGSGPTVDVASRTSGLGGMILQSPIASAGHVVLPEQMAKALAGFDLFKNYEKIKDVTCRTLMIHGRADTMVPFEHAQMLFPELRNQHPPLWIDGAGHHDMPDDLCLNAVANFVAYIEERNAKLYGRASSPDDDPADGDGRGHWLFGGVAALFGGGGS
jgi:pimeloyl-ACP methyl ester carboxylesterase